MRPIPPGNRSIERKARLAAVMANANGKAPAGVRLIDTERSLSAAEIRKGKSLEKLARRIRGNGDKSPAKLARAVGKA